MPEERPRSSDETGLRIQREVGLAKLPGSGFRSLSEIINRSLVHIRTSKDQWVLHRIGRHDLYGPDYRLVCAWAEELKLPKEEILSSLLSGSTIFQSTLSNGHFRKIYLDGRLPISEFPSISGLIIDELDLIQNIDLSGLKPKSLPNLINLAYIGCGLQQLDLSPFPNLDWLQCQDNQLVELDLSFVPHLNSLLCWDNPLVKLDLSKVPNLVKLDCGYVDLPCHQGSATKLNFSHVPKLVHLMCHNMEINELNLYETPNLTTLFCGKNFLTQIDLAGAPNLEKLFCDGNQLTELDIRPLRNLRKLHHANNSLYLIQRPDQNFK